MQSQRLSRCILAATGVFVVALIFGLCAPVDASGGILSELDQLIAPLRNAGPFVLFLVIVVNNALKALGVVALGVVIGIPPAVFLVLNGYLLGVVITGFSSMRGLAYIVASLAPHGVIEIPLLLLAAGLGFSVGWESIGWLARRTGMVRAQLRASMKVYVRWILPGLTVAAVAEVFVTPLVVALVSGGTPS